MPRIFAKLVNVMRVSVIAVMRLSCPINNVFDLADRIDLICFCLGICLREFTARDPELAAGRRKPETLAIEFVYLPVDLEFDQIAELIEPFRSVSRDRKPFGLCSFAALKHFIRPSTRNLDRILSLSATATDIVPYIENAKAIIFALILRTFENCLKLV